MITVHSQFLGFSLNGWKDHYEIRTAASEEYAIQTVSECIRSEVTGRSYDGSYLFRRGSRFWTWFSFGPEHWPLQEITMRIEDGVMHLKYEILGGIWFRGKPCGLEKEARLIASRLNAGEQADAGKPDPAES